LFFPSAVAGLFSFFTKRSERKQPQREKRTNEAERGWQAASGGAVRDQTRVIVWRDIGASARATEEPWLKGLHLKEAA
jgi:hypothetical protein